VAIRPAIVIAIALAAACGGGGGSDSSGGDGNGDGDAAVDCPGFAAPTETGAIESSEAREISGLTASLEHPDVLWAHNDNAAGARLLALATDGEDLGVAALDVDVEDFEDIALAAGPDPERDYLYLADTGDNELERGAIALLRLVEPAVETAEVSGVDAFTLTYDDGGPHDAEAIVIEPDTGDLYVITKSNGDDPVTLVFRADGVAGADGGSVELERVLSQAEAPGLTGRVTTAALSPDGEQLLLGFVDESFRLWERTGSIADTLTAAPCAAPTVEDHKIEGAAFAPESDAYFIVGEGEHPPLYRIEISTRDP